MITTRRYMTWAAVAAVVIVIVACAKHGPVLDRSFGDGKYVVGDQIAAGTYKTANSGPHTATVQCEWTVAKASNEGTVTLRSHDTDNQLQQVYLAGGDVITSHNCGVWAWASSRNLT